MRHRSPVNGVFPNENGKVKEGLYVVGWAKRGPSGTIPTNRAEAQQVAQEIAKEVADRTGQAVLLSANSSKKACRLGGPCGLASH